MKYEVVIDTNVWVSALRSKQGASFRLISLLGSPEFDVHVSVPLLFEYEEVAKRMAKDVGLTMRDIDSLLDYVCRIAQAHEIFFLWRPFLKDPQDDHVLELAVEAQCDFIITYNLRDFSGIEQFGLHAMNPREFLQRIGDLK